MIKESKEHSSESLRLFSTICQLIQGVSRLERTVREASANGEHDRIAKIVDQLCHDYAYAVHQPHARNGGLIGLAAASIALGSVSTGECPAERITSDGPIGGGCQIFERNCSSGPCLLLRPRCAGQVLCLRKHV